MPGFCIYSKVSNRQRLWSSRGGQKKYQKLIVGVGWNSRVVGKILIAKGEGGWLLNCFFLSFSSHENQIIKKLCVYSKSKIKTKVTSKQNLEYFKMINQRIFIHKSCFLPPGQYLLKYLCFRLHQGSVFLCLSTCVFRFY